MSVSYALLGLLERGPAHGYDLKREYDAHLGAVHPIRFGQVYATLARLARDGLVRPRGEESGRGPERKLYGVTRSGSHAFGSWLEEPVTPAAHLDSELVTKVLLALLAE